MRTWCLSGQLRSLLKHPSFFVHLSTVPTKRMLSPFVRLWWMNEAKHSLECHFGCNYLTPSDSSAGKTPSSPDEMRARVLPFISVAKGQDLMHRFCSLMCSAYFAVKREESVFVLLCLIGSARKWEGAIHDWYVQLQGWKLKTELWLLLLLQKLKHLWCVHWFCLLIVLIL